MIAGGGVNLAASVANGNDAPATSLVASPPAPLPAVDGVNLVTESLGGAIGDKSVGAAGGLLAIPLGNSFGVELSGGGGALNDHGLTVAGLNLFWRDPSRGRLGFVSNYLYWHTPVGGITLYRAGGQAECYFDRVTLSAMAGAAGYRAFDASFGPLSVRFPGHTGGFDEASIDYYPVDNLRLSLGQAYYGTSSSGTAGAEWGLPIGGATMAALFVNGSYQPGTTSVLAGLHFYFGEHAKSLIERNRQDDAPSIFPSGMVTPYSSPKCISPPVRGVNCNP